MIKQSDISKIGLRQLASNIKAALSENDLFQLNEYDLAYSCLKQIDFEKLDNKKESIDELCIKTLSALNLSKFISTHSPVTIFLTIILDITVLPIIKKYELEEVVKFDLTNINQLIKEYESTDFIQRYIKSDENPRNHQEKTLCVFYKRTLNKRNEIIDYYLYKLNERAIEKSKTNLNPLKHLDLKNYETHLDFPYKDYIIEFTPKLSYKYEINYKKLDFKQIDSFYHKIYLTGIVDYQNKSNDQVIIELESNKEIEEKLKNEFNRIINRIDRYNILKPRKVIFEELKSLFNEKKWYGFYALSIPQIEGIFTDLNALTNTKIGGTLTDKVGRIKPAFGEYDYYNFDYFEFYLPNLRNKFAHTGKEDNVRSKYYLLLLDIIHLLSIIDNIDSPVIKIKNIIEQGLSYFENINLFCLFIQMIKEIKADKNDNQELIDEVTDFINTELLTKISFPDFIDVLENDFTKAHDEFEDIFGLFAESIVNEKILIFQIPNNKLINSMHKIDLILSDSAKMTFEDHLKLLCDTYYFVSNFESIFFSENKSINDRIVAFKSKHDKVFSALKILLSKSKCINTEEVNISYVLEKYEHIDFLKQSK